MTYNSFSKQAKESLNKVVEKFKTGDVGPIVKIATLKRTEEVPFDKWSLSNKLLAYLQTNSLDLRGYQQWKAVGRYVKKGSKAAYILAPRKVPDKDDEDKMICVGFFTISVFPIEATDGEPVNYGYGKIEPPPLIEVAEEFGLTVSYQDLLGAYGDTNIKTGDIRLATADEQVFFHELAHAIRAKTGLIKIDTKENYAREEIIAEFTAAVLAQIYGKDITGKTGKYVREYTKEDPFVAITKVLSEVQLVLNEISKVKQKEAV